MKKMRNIAWAFLLFCSFAVQGQVVPQREDTTRIVIADTVPVIRQDSVAKPSQVVSAPQVDVVKQKADSVILATSSDAFFAPAAIFSPSPRKAVIYSAIFPGLGQVYNRKYWKLPILYGGLVTFTYFVTWNNRYYQTYFEWHRSIIDGDPNTNEWHTALPYGMTPQSVDQTWFTGVLSDRKDYYRYYRDFSFIGAVAVYLLGIVDAYVDAQLFDFDISPDLSMRLAPAVLHEGGYGNNYSGNPLGFRWTVNF